MSVMPAAIDDGVRIAARIVQPAGEGLAGVGSRMCVRHDDSGG
jgi:hypothetical protein